MKNNRTLLSIIVPCFNESKALDAFHKEMMEQMEDGTLDYEELYDNIYDNLEEMYE